MGGYGKHVQVPPEMSNGQTLDYHLVDAAGQVLTAAGGSTDIGDLFSGAPVVVGGRDAGAAVRVLSVDTLGRTVVVGAAADGTAVVGSPVRIGGKDGNGNTQDVLTTTTGVLQNEVQGTGVNVAASTYYNAAVSADVDAAVAAADGVRLVGFAVRETAGAAASFAVVNGATGAAAGKVYPVNLAANESTSEWLHPGIACASGISVDWISGTFAIALHFVTVV